MVIRSSTGLQSRTTIGQARPDDFGAAGDGDFGAGTDSTAAFQAAIDWITANPGPTGGGQLIIPPGSWRITAPLIVPSYVSVVGAGDDSQVLMDNDVGLNYQGDQDAGGTGAGLFNVFTQDPWNGNAPYFTNCQFSNFRVTGTNDPYVQIDQWQSAAIDMSNFAEAMVIRNVTFESLHGFAIHGRGNGDGLDVSGCQFIRTGNSGVNTGISNCRIAQNKFSFSEGIEVTGRNCLVIGNSFENSGNTNAPNQASPVLVMGGNITPNGNFPGGAVIGNSISDCTGGIYVGSNATDYSVIGNTIIRVNAYGIILTGAGIAGQEPHRSIVANNVVRSAGSDAAGVMYGIWVADGTEQAMVVNNNVKLNADPGFGNGVFGIRCDSPGGIVRGNHVSDALTLAYYFRNAPDMVFDGNSADGANVGVSYDGTVSFRGNLPNPADLPEGAFYSHLSGAAATFIAGDRLDLTLVQANDVGSNVTLSGSTDLVLAAGTGKYRAVVTVGTEAPAGGDVAVTEVLANSAQLGTLRVEQGGQQSASWQGFIDTSGAAQTIELNRLSVVGTGRLNGSVSIERVG